MADRDTPSILRNGRTNRFELADAPQRAHLNYHLADRRLTLVHTEVFDDLEGQGIASALVRTALRYADEKDLAVVPICPFVANWLDRHPESRPTSRSSIRDRRSAPSTGRNRRANRRPHFAAAGGVGGTRPWRRTSEGTSVGG